LEVLSAGQDLVDRCKLTRKCDDFPHPGGIVDDVAAKHLGPSGVRSHQRGQDPNEGRLPGTVRSEQPKDPALLEIQVDSGKRRRRPKPLDDPLDVNSRIRHHSPLRF
jgi:hypothetical protein